MEFNDIVTLIIFIAFFVLPSVFRGLGKKKKRSFAPKKKKRPFSLFGKVRDAIQEFIRELEKQALEARQKQGGEQEGTLWDGMAEEDIEIDLPEVSPAPAPAEKKAPQPYAPSARTGKKAAPPQAVARGGDTDGAVSALPALNGIGRNPLQNAVVWAEILGKPVALRDD